MVFWIVLAVVVFALVVLALAVRSVLARLGPLHRAAERLRRRQDEVEGLREAALRLQHGLEGLAVQAGEAQRRITAIKAASGR